MQLKKKLSAARRTIAVSAVTAAMLVTSLPAFAHDGLQLGTATHLSLGADIKGLLKDIKKDIKLAVKAEKKVEKSEKKAERQDRELTRSASATAAVSCRTGAERAHRDAIKKAKVERDNETRAARETFLASLLAARNQHRADVSASASAVVSASGTDATVQLRSAARLRYRNAVKAAETAFATAKRKATGEYRNAVEDANSAFHRARLNCRVSASAGN